MPSKRSQKPPRKLKNLPAKGLARNKAKQVRGGAVVHESVVSEKIGPDHIVHRPS